MLAGSNNTIVINDKSQEFIYQYHECSLNWEWYSPEVLIAIVIVVSSNKDPESKICYLIP